MERERTLKDLQKYKEYGEAMLQNLKLLQQTPLPSDLASEFDLARLKQRLQDAAQKTVDRASDAVKIGIMGEFSSGKTLLLGSLVGYADLLPHGQKATTGNVTAIHLFPQAELQTTQVKKSEVKYLSHEEALACLGYMLEKAIERSRQAALPTAHLTTLTQLDRQSPNVWDAVLRWTRDAWNVSKNLELRYLLQELVIFSRTYLAYGHAVCGRTYRIDAETAKYGLQLPDFPVTQLTTFAELSFDPPPLHTQPIAVTAQDLQHSFVLIRRVDVTVAVSQQIWDMSALQGTNQVALFDFPGLGASHSGVRDAFLSLQELGEVQTVLILLDARVPGGDRANQIFTMMQQHYPNTDIKDRLLVGIGRFDQLPLDNEKVLDELLQDNGMFELNEATVLDQIKVLKTLINSAQAFTTDPKRLLFLSPLLGLAALAKDKTHNFQIGSPEFLARLDYADGSLAQAKKLRDKWQQISDRLRDSDPQGIVGQRLQSFAQDGGIYALQSLIQTHVNQHGLEQIHAGTRNAAKAVQAEQTMLQTALKRMQQTDLPIIDATVVKQLTQTIQTLIELYRKFQKKLETEPLRNLQGTPISEIIKDELSFKIYGWDIWNLIFNAARNGIIPHVEAQESDKKIISQIFGSRRTVAPKIPIKSDEFYPNFEITIQELSGSILELARHGVQILLKDLSDELREPREQLHAILKPEMANQILQKFGPDEEERFRFLLGANDPERQWKDAIIENAEISTANVLDVAPQNCFPLIISSADSPSRVFDWGKLPSPEPRLANHQILVLRIRDELVSSAELYLVEQVSQVTKQVQQKLSDILTDLIPALEILIRQDSLLRYIAAGNQAQQTPAWLQTLSQIASIAAPD